MESQPWSDITNNSGLQGNQSFFDPNQQQVAAVPSHTASITWKSDWLKEKEEYERVRQRVRHVAPALFRPDPRPELDPSVVFPQNTTEWIEHKKGMLGLMEADKRKDIENMKAQITTMEKIPAAERKTVPAFGGKVFKDGLSPVLALPTIWSDNYDGRGHGIAPWPSRGELQWNGDSRQNGYAKTKCGRFLPPPRHPTAGVPQEQSFIRPWPLDETGPIHTAGPQPDETRYQNALMDNDPEFEAVGAAFLGSDLMTEVGERTEPYIFVQQHEELLQPVAEEQEMQYGYHVEPGMPGMAMAPGFQYEALYNMPGQYWVDGQEQTVMYGEGGSWY